MKKILTLAIIAVIIGITPSTAIEINELSDLNATVTKNTENKTKNSTEPVNELEDLGAILVNSKKNNTIPKPVNELEDLGAILVNSKTNKTYEELEELEAIFINHTNIPGNELGLIETENDSSVKIDNDTIKNTIETIRAITIVLGVFGAIGGIGVFFHYWTRLWGIVRWVIIGGTRYHGYSLSTDGKLPGNFFVEHYVDQPPEIGEFIGMGGFLRHGTPFRSPVTDRYSCICSRGYRGMSDWWRRTQFRNPFVLRSPFTRTPTREEPLLTSDFSYL